MNFRIIAYIVGWVCNFQAMFMVLPCITALIYQEHEFFAFLISMIVCLIVGLPLTIRKPKNKVFYTKDGCVAVALSWFALCISGAVPFVLSGAIPHPIDAFFETVSGFTTTGSSILTDVEVLPHCILIWRSFTHWIGGMGVLVFLLSLLPLAGGYHMNLMKAESPGPSVSKLVPKVQQTAKILYTIYIGMTLFQIILLLIGRIPLFDTLCISFGTAGTGGFGIVNDSMGSYSTYCQVVTTIFMILFGVNFSAYYLLLTKKFVQAFKFEEVRYYFGIILAAITQDKDGHFKFVVAEGVNEEGPILSFGDTNMRTRFTCGAREFVNRWSEAGPTHHMAAATGRHIDTILKVAKIFNIPVDIVTR